MPCEIALTDHAGYGEADLAAGHALPLQPLPYAIPSTRQPTGMPLWLHYQQYFAAGSSHGCLAVNYEFVLVCVACLLRA